MLRRTITTALSLMLISTLQVLGMVNIENPQTILTKLLTLKFSLAGEQLVTDVEKIRKDFLPSISKEEILEFLQTQQTHAKTDYKVKVWIEDNADKNSLVKSLTAASYFPKQLDLIEDLIALYKEQCEDYYADRRDSKPKLDYKARCPWINHLHVQNQLAYAAHYDHPDSFDHLKRTTVYIGKGNCLNDSDEDSDSSDIMTKRFETTLEERETANAKYKLINLYFDINNNKEEKDQLRDADWISRPQAQRDIILDNLLDIVKEGPNHPQPKHLPTVIKTIEKMNWDDADS